MLDHFAQLLIRTGKQIALSRDLEVLELDSILGAVARMRAVPGIKTAVAACLCTNPEEIQWPEFLVERAVQADCVPVELTGDRQLETGPVFREIFNGLTSSGRNVSLQDFMNAILTSPLALAFGEVMALHAAQSRDELKPKGMFSKLRELATLGERLEKALSRDVMGQPDAVHLLAEHYLQVVRNPPSSGLRGIFTFLGPPGVGKTMLAEKFAEALSEVEGTSYEALKFPMEMGDRESAKFMLFGVDKTYKSGHTGQLYKAIQRNPNQILIFDEVEKAQPEILQSLLTLLNDGKLKDQFAQEWVDLSKCFAVFTTNLGQELFSSRNRTGILRGKSFSKDDLFDLLASAKVRDHHEGKRVALSPEFVSRLRKGGAVLFNHLTGVDYMRLLDRLIETGNGSRGPTPTLSIDTECKQLLLLTLLPDISPRRAVAEMGMLRERWIAELVKHQPQGLIEADPAEFVMAMRLELDKESQALHQNIRAGQGLQILVVDNDARMEKFIRRYLRQSHEKIPIGIHRVTNPADALQEVDRRKPDLLLLDMDLDPSENLPDGALGLHRRILQLSPELPIFLFSQFSEWEKKLTEIVSEGGARGFFSFEETSGKVSIPKRQIAEFHRLLEDALYEKILSGMTRSRHTLDFFHRFEFDAKSSRVWICVNKITQRQVVSMAENSGGIRPAEMPTVTFDEVFGLERAKERLRTAVEFSNNPGLLKKFGIRPPSGYLLAGPSGTGKTHIARAVANAAGRLFYSLAAGELEGNHIGESEERIRNLFQAARKYAPSIIFIDEIDAIAGRRAPSDHQSLSTLKMLNQLLVCMDGFADDDGSVLVLAATNRPEALDPAILRPGRFDEIIRIEAPDAKAREHMFRKRLEALPLAKEVLNSVPELVCRTTGMSPAEVDRVIREAVYPAALAGRKQLTLSDFHNACHLVRYGASRRDIQLDKTRLRMTAWHEAGHAVARLLLEPGSKLDFVSIVPNESGALGFAAWQQDETKHCLSAQDYRHWIMISLAGREAEKLCPGAGDAAINNGAYSDYQSATEMAWDSVTKLGFHSGSAPLSLNGIPRDFHAGLAETIQPAVAALMAECLQACEDLMKKNRDLLEAIANALLEKQALEGAEVHKLFAAARVGRAGGGGKPAKSRSARRPQKNRAER